MTDTLDDTRHAYDDADQPLPDSMPGTEQPYVPVFDPNVRTAIYVACTILGVILAVAAPVAIAANAPEWATILLSAMAGGGVRCRLQSKPHQLGNRGKSRTRTPSGIICVANKHMPSSHRFSGFLRIILSNSERNAPPHSPTMVRGAGPFFIYGGAHQLWRPARKPLLTASSTASSRVLP